MTTFTVPYPPQANHMYTVARGRKIKSPAYRQWAEDAAKHIIAQRPDHVLGRYDIEITAPRPDLRRRDLDNLLKPLGDAIVAAGVVQDDSLVECLTIKWGPLEKGGLVAVRLWAAGAFA